MLYYFGVAENYVFQSDCYLLKARRSLGRRCISLRFLRRILQEILLVLVLLDLLLMGRLLLNGGHLALSGQGMPLVVGVSLFLLPMGATRSVHVMFLSIQFLMAWENVTLPMGLITMRVLLHIGMPWMFNWQGRLHPTITDYDVSKFSALSR
ncbi:UNVERIFIED_CONTAM: hypothetical protein Sradi_2080700 [Sesamum radiatum]|uniref:Uncharacterized protein n=1 Tax=Sesamum radiatum TaxID=300843 RepID=A0AAW2TIA1_SESRA